MSERVQSISFCMLIILGTSHIPLVGPVALFPAMGGTLGIVGIVRAIRSLLIGGNASSGIFAVCYLLVAYVSVPMLVETCLHLQTNREQCYKCPSTSQFSSCPTSYDTVGLGAYCYRSEEGSQCMADDCQSRALKSGMQCYCKNAYWGETWDSACSETETKRVMPLITPLAMLSTAIFVIGSIAGLKIGCCNPDRFRLIISMLEEQVERDDAAQGHPSETVAPVSPTRSQPPESPPQSRLNFAEPIHIPRSTVVVQGIPMGERFVDTQAHMGSRQMDDPVQGENITHRRHEADEKATHIM